MPLVSRVHAPCFLAHYLAIAHYQQVLWLDFGWSPAAWLHLEVSPLTHACIGSSSLRLRLCYVFCTMETGLLSLPDGTPDIYCSFQLYSYTCLIISNKCLINSYRLLKKKQFVYFSLVKINKNWLLVYLETDGKLQGTPFWRQQYW